MGTMEEAREQGRRRVRRRNGRTLASNRGAISSRIAALKGELSH
jgi:hypothetical protein